MSWITVLADDLIQAAVLQRDPIPAQRGSHIHAPRRPTLAANLINIREIRGKMQR